MCILRDEASLETYGFPDFGKPASLFCVRFLTLKFASNGIKTSVAGWHVPTSNDVVGG